MRTECILVIDLGTSKVRANLVNPRDGEIILSSSLAFKWFYPEKGQCEADALSEWEKTQDVVEKVLSDAKGKYEILAITFSFFGGGLLFMDSDGTPIRNMMLPMDNRAKKDYQILYGEFLKKKRSLIKNKGGFPEHIYAHAKVLWLKNNVPEDFEKTAVIGNIQQFIFNKLGLGFFIDKALASGQQFYDSRENAFDIALCEYLGLPLEKLGEKPLLGDTILGNISKFGRVNLGNELPVILGTYDLACGMLGLGCIPGSKSVIANVTGTTDNIGMLTSTYTDGGTCRCGPIKDSYVFVSGGVISGPNLDWYIKTFYPEEDRSIYNQLFNRNLFDGKNRVFLCRDVSSGDGALNGINLTTTKADIFKAIIEGSTFPLINYVKIITSNGEEKFDCIRIGGGNARTKEWSQLKADIFGLRVEKVANLEISSIGATILASVAIGFYPNYSEAIQNMVRVEQVFEPNPDLTRLYESRYHEYLSRI